MSSSFMYRLSINRMVLLRRPCHFRLETKRLWRCLQSKAERPIIPNIKQMWHQSVKTSRGCFCVLNSSYVNKTYHGPLHNINGGSSADTFKCQAYNTHPGGQRQLQQRAHDANSYADGVQSNAHYIVQDPRPGP